MKKLADWQHPEEDNFMNEAIDWMMANWRGIGAGIGVACAVVTLVATFL